ncbi:MAG: helix-turn-helix domain-containing protein [Oscillospiraceae bacterium]
MDKMTFSVQEAAEVMGISHSKMYQMVREDIVPNIKLGKRYVIPKAKFVDWVNNAAVGGAY